MADNDTTYNGWTNYPTWAINLWQDSTEMWGETAQNIYNDAEPTEYGTKIQHARIDLADCIQEYHEEQIDEMTGESGPYTDVMRWAIGQIDWRELAEHAMENIDLEDDEE